MLISDFAQYRNLFQNLKTLSLSTPGTLQGWDIVVPTIGIVNELRYQLTKCEKEFGPDGTGVERNPIDSLRTAFWHCEPST